jgi:2-hydroxy-3-keto-5-methylthiopentenyl-1-phosphate phosphatase
VESAPFYPFSRSYVIHNLSDTVYQHSHPDAIIESVETKTLIQCDFDNTVTYKDISFLLLDAFAGAAWREHLEKYQEGKISVGEFNRLSFSMVKAGHQEMLDYIKDRVRLRPGFQEFAQFCREKGFRLVIVSNGLDFYIEEILKGLGLKDIEHHAAETRFNQEGLKVRYVGADGTVLDRDFKLSWVKKFLNEGYRVVYIGDGNSDFVPAQQCHHIFATASLLIHCQQNDVACTPFADFNDVIKAMELW